MAFDRKAVYFDDLDEIFDEKGSSFCAMRRVQWVKEGEEPDREKSKLELRKYRMGPEGEVTGKGFSFLTEEGPDELVNVLIGQGYGDTREVLLKLKERENFKEAVETLYDDTSSDDYDGEYFDMRSVLLDDTGDNNGGE